MDAAVVFFHLCLQPAQFCSKGPVSAKGVFISVVWCETLDKRNLSCIKETNVEDHGGYIFSNEENLGNLNVSLAIGRKPSMWTFYLQLAHKWNVH